MSSATPRGGRPKSPTPTKRIPVQDWTKLTHVPPSNIFASIIDTTPNHVVLPQDVAQKVHNTMFAVLVIQREIALKFNKNMFSRWAWNLTPDGKLKSEPSLSAEEMVVWEEYMKEIEGLTFVSFY
ncbi:hypothetical protein HBI56_128970 [Parastagonospora nodorum]|nr:hypothetical protein HBH53_176370 [Parastagonospora nodorum]KAH4063856.1 hypothetical protein HBH50_187650 [Parastagonospora nodorum]KAH4079639.1 hypothetical protein HBH48_216570 [Parastagonospora nodorum]KAH4086512.1 hypothetical protein HBH46_205180 [Parastagonospora nodorum]KAH4164777.1 hypothetical protein HBH43_145270 [Parastagonospora nodorum]